MWYGYFWFFLSWGSGWYVKYLKTSKQKMLFLNLKFISKQTLSLNSEESWKRVWFSTRFEQNLCQQINSGEWSPTPPFFCSSHWFNEKDWNVVDNTVLSKGARFRAILSIKKKQYKPWEQTHISAIFSWKPISVQCVNHSYLEIHCIKYSPKAKMS